MFMVISPPNATSMTSLPKRRFVPLSLWLVSLFVRVLCACLRVLLDQLLQYEPASEDEEEATDYSSSENETVDKKLFKTSHTKEVSLVVYDQVVSYALNSGVELCSVVCTSGWNMVTCCHHYLGIA